MVQDGIERELSSLKEIIDAYEDELDSVKDFHDYQNQISDKASNIASLQKQLSAYANDNSEEARATVQKLKVELDKAQTDLTETQYEHSISEQKKLLSTLYDDYETVLNSRLDDIDGLIIDMIGTVDSNAAAINSTLKESANSVGYSINGNTKQVWSGSNGVQSGVVSAVGSIQSGVNQMISESGTASKVKAYKTGGLVDYTGLAKVDGTASKPEMVLNAGDTDNILSMVEKLKDVPISVKGHEYAGHSSIVHHAIAMSNYDSKMNAIQNHTFNQDVSSNVTLNVNIDHVDNYDEFVEKLKRDSKFEKFIQSATVDRMVGGSKLAKYKYL